MSPRHIVWVFLLAACATGSDESGTFGNVSHGVPGVSTTNGTSGGDTGEESGTTTGGHDDTSGMGDGPGDTSTGDPDTSTTNDTADDDDDGDPSDDTGPMEVNVQNHTGVCGGVLWCATEEGEGVGPHGYAECFDNVELAPPFDVTEIRYAVGAKENDPSTFRVEVRAWTGSAPGNVIGSQDLTAADATVGVHGIVLQSPVRVNASSFCVAVEGNEAFAIRRDDNNPVPNRAFVKAEECGIIDHVTLQSLDFPSNLCMSAKIVPAQ